jgi:hypothetical protein
MFTHRYVVDVGSMTRMYLWTIYVANKLPCSGPLARWLVFPARADLT